MNKIIREGVFETNSSSSHSISISNSDAIYDSIYPNEDGIIELNGKHFGWEYLKYNDSLTKANYIFLYIRDWCEEYKQQEWNDDLKKYEVVNIIPNKSEEFMELFSDIILKQTGAYSLKTDTKDGYIDHESVESRKLDYLFQDKELLRKFIFDKNSWLFLGNDNDCTPNDFYEVETYKQNEIIHPIKKYQVEFENYPQLNFQSVDKVNLEKVLNQLNHLSISIAAENGNYNDYKWNHEDFLIENILFNKNDLLLNSDHINTKNKIYQLSSLLKYHHNDSEIYLVIKHIDYIFKERGCKDIYKYFWKSKAKHKKLIDNFLKQEDIFILKYKVIKL